MNNSPESEKMPERDQNDKLDGASATIRTPFTEKLENYWYHYKWATIISLFVAITLIVCLVQCANVARNDSLVLYAGSYDMNAGEFREVKSALESVVGDYNEDGDREVELVNLFIMSPDEVRAFNEAHKDEGLTVNTNLLSTNWEAFQNEILSGEASVCIMSQYCYDYVADADGFSDKYVAVYLKHTEFAKYNSVFQIFPDDTILCLRRISTMQSIFRRERVEREYANQVDFYNRILSFTAPEGWDPNN